MRSNRLALSTLTLAVLVLLARASLAACANEASAKQAYERGVNAARERNLELALLSFQQANELCPNPVTQLATAMAYTVAGQSKPATDALERYIAEAGAAVNWCGVLDTRRQIAALDGVAVHQLSVTATPAAAHLTVREVGNGAPPSLGDGCTMQAAPNAPTGQADAATYAVALPSGRYVVRGALDASPAASPDASPQREITVDVAGATSTELMLQGQPKAPVASPAMSTPMPRNVGLAETGKDSIQPKAWYNRPENWVWIGSGAVAAASIVTGVWALSLQSDLDQKCGDQRRCSLSEWSEVDRHRTLGIVSTTGFVLAGTGALVGVGIHFLSRPNKEASPSSSIGCSITPAHVAVDWRF